jgi:hypothetical protein
LAVFTANGRDRVTERAEGVSGGVGGRFVEGGFGMALWTSDQSPRPTSVCKVYLPVKGAGIVSCHGVALGSALNTTHAGLSDPVELVEIFPLWSFGVIGGVRGLRNPVGAFEVFVILGGGVFDGVVIT